MFRYGFKLALCRGWSLLRRRKRQEPELLLAVPAWKLGISIGGRVLEYCVDSYFINFIDKAFRRILLVYPNNMCKPVPSPHAYTLTAEAMDAEKLFEKLVESCRRAREEASRPRARGPLRSLFFGLHPDDIAAAEAYNAWELCILVFGDREDGFLAATLLSKTRSYIEYPVGVLEDIGWKRLYSLARLEPRVKEEVDRIVREASGLHRF